MSLLKRLTKSRTGQTMLAAAAASYLRLLQRSVRWRIERPPETEALLDGGAPFIACFWHGRLATMRAAWAGPPGQFHMLISEHRDGALIARAMARLGFGTISGSSRRGGTAALRTLSQLLAEGGCVGITPDGPRGPRMRAKPGAIKAAQLSGLPLVPLSGSATNCRFLGSWDRFCLVLPFGHGEILFGTPIAVPRGADRATMETLRQELERQLNGLTDEADKRCGQPGIEPAPPPATEDAEPPEVGHARA